MPSVRLIQELYGAFARGDVPAVLAAFDPRIEWHEAESNPYQPSGAAWVGPDAVLQHLFLRLAGDWEGITVHPRVLHDAGDTVVMEGRYSGTHASSGRALDAQVCHVWTLRDGEVVRFQQYVDTARLHAVMGTPRA